MANDPNKPNIFKIEGSEGSIKDATYRIIYEISLVNYPENSEQSTESFLATILPADYDKSQPPPVVIAFAFIFAAVGLAILYVVQKSILKCIAQHKRDRRVLDAAAAAKVNTSDQVSVDSQHSTSRSTVRYPEPVNKD